MSLEWLLIRGSGIAAFSLLTVSTIWGLLTSAKLLGRRVKAKPLTWFHESVGIGALVATMVHTVTLSIHDYLDFTWAEILVPGRSDWRPLPVALGIVATYVLAVVVISFYIKRWIGHKTWRVIHFASFGVFVAALLHGMLAGTDTAAAMMLGLYLGAAIVVFTLIALRLTQGSSETPRPAGPRTTEEPVTAEPAA